MVERAGGQAGGKQRFFDNHAGSWENGRRDDPLVAGLVADLPLKPGDFVVEPGCGTGLVSELIVKRIAPGGCLLACDISPRMIELALEKNLGPSVEFRVTDVLRLELADATADAVVCVRVFPHLDDQAAALAGFNRLLKPGGLLAIAHTAGRVKLNEYHAHMGSEVSGDTIPDEPGMRNLLAAAGFELNLIEDREERYLVMARKSRSL